MLQRILGRLTSTLGRTARVSEAGQIPVPIIGAELAAMVGEDDGIIVQETTEDAVMANTTLRWFRRRAPSVADVSPNVVVFPVIAAPTAWTQGRAPGEAAVEIANGEGVVRLAEAS